jgi:hypothetical protein
MRVSDAFPSKHLKADDLRGATIRVTIEKYALEEIGQEKSRKVVLYFRNKEKGLVLNKTNATNIETMHGPNIDEWVGCEIELFPSMTDYQGKSVDCVRCKPVRPQRPQQTAENIVRQHQASERTPPPAPLDDDVPF